MTKCYLVYICTGEYEDFRDEVLKAFLYAEDAEKYANSIRDRLQQMGCYASGDYTRCNTNSKLDGFSIDYTGAWVTVSKPVDLVSAFS